MQEVELISTKHFASPKILLSVQREVARYSDNSPSVIKGKWLGALYQNEIETGTLIDCRLEWVSDLIGFGVFLNRVIKKGEYIGEYVGEVKRYLPLRSSRNDYVGELRISDYVPLKFIVDARNKGNLTRYINHSETPNLQSITVICKGMMHAIFVAKKEIQNDAQLTYDYGPAYWRHRKEPLAII